MRERTALEQGIELQRTMEQEVADSEELIALGEEEDDEDTVAEAEAGLARLKEQVCARAHMHEHSIQSPSLSATRPHTLPHVHLGWALWRL